MLLAVGVGAVVVALAAVLVVFVTGLPLGNQGGNGTSTNYPPYTNLPPGCVKPADGYLVIANQNGFNDSIQHGAPANQWPIIRVKQGTTVNITVCNSDIQAHGFQITHYFDSNIETVSPGKVVHVSFVADQVGDFDIYCSIFCTIHIYMQNGLLAVSA
jgi:hypothetical protein